MLPLISHARLIIIVMIWFYCNKATGVSWLQRLIKTGILNLFLVITIVCCSVTTNGVEANYAVTPFVGTGHNVVITTKKGCICIYIYSLSEVIITKGVMSQLTSVALL